MLITVQTKRSLARRPRSNLLEGRTLNPELVVGLALGLALDLALGLALDLVLSLAPALALKHLGRSVIQILVIL